MIFKDKMLGKILNGGNELIHSDYTYDSISNSHSYRIFEYKDKFYKFEYINGEMTKSYEVKKASWMEYKTEWVEA